MPVLNAALVGAEQPPLEKRSNGVDSRHDLMGRFRAVADDSDLVLVAGRRQPAITTPSVGMDHRPGRHGILDEGKKAVRGHVLDAPKADPADAATPLLGRHRDDGLCFGFPAPLSLFGAADIGFVNLDSAGEAIPTGPDHARMARGVALAERRKEYVEAAQCLALNTRRVVLVHILPNCLPSLIVVATLEVAHAISLEATLSFLGVGLPVTEPSLGLLISNGFDYLLSGYPWISVLPGVALLITVISINLVGDELRDILNPRLQQ